MQVAAEKARKKEEAERAAREAKEKARRKAQEQERQKQVHSTALAIPLAWFTGSTASASRKTAAILLYAKKILLVMPAKCMQDLYTSIFCNHMGSSLLYEGHMEFKKLHPISIESGMREG